MGYWAGGTTSAGALMKPSLAIHTNEGTHIIGQMFTMMDFLSAEHAYATSITSLQTCNLLELSNKAPPAPTPPTPGPAPTPGTPHYEKPPCQAGEAQASVQDT